MRKVKKLSNDQPPMAVAAGMTRVRERVCNPLISAADAQKMHTCEGGGVAHQTPAGWHIA
jgi:hypothetical protein